MSIRERLEDAQFLFSQGRKDGALLSMLVAVAATSRRRYPKDIMGDKESFIRFLVDETPAVTCNCTWLPTSEVDYERNLNPKISAEGKPNQGGFWLRVPGAAELGWADGMMPLPAVLYKYVRCSLAHEGGLPSNVEFVDSPAGQLKFIVEEKRLVLSHTLLEGLSRAVTYAPENFDEFLSIRDMPDEVVAWMLFAKLRDRQVAYVQRRAVRVKEILTGKK